MSDDQAAVRYRALLSSIDAGFCVVEVLFDSSGRPADYRFLEVNPAFERQTGLVEATGKRMRELAPEHESYWFEVYGQVALTGEPVRFEHEARALGGRWYEVTAFRVGPPEHHQVGILFTDIAARKRIEDALRESERQNKLMIENVRDYAMFITDAEGRVSKWNIGAERLLGWPEDEIVGQPADIIFTPEDRERGVPQKEMEVAQREGHASDERWHQRKDGSRFFANGMMMAVRDEAGQLVGFTKVMRDETDRNRAEEAARKARSEAESANRAKDRFIAVLSHELRTPLTPVAMAATAMEMDPEMPYEFREDVAMIRRNVELETRLIDDLLDLSRVISGKLRVNRQPIHVHEVVRHVLETVGPELHEKQVGVETTLAARHDFVDADPARLQQALWNLLKNAGKFTPAGGRVAVRTRDDEGASQIVVEVADTGRGIAPDVLPRVFDPFEQGADEVTRRHGGMGLGLAIAKAIVDLHGGTISAASDGEGKGSTFAVALPLREAAPMVATPGPEKPATAPERPLRLLLVEDHPDTAKTLARLLRLDGFGVLWADSVTKGVELAASHPFDIVVSDLGLPDGTGYDLIRRLRRDHPTLVGIAMSGYGMEEDIRRSRDVGFVDHLIKPVTLPQLREAIRRASSRAAAGGQ